MNALSYSVRFGRGAVEDAFSLGLAGRHGSQLSSLQMIATPLPNHSDQATCQQAFNIKSSKLNGRA